jgi:hypothetical protein
VWTPPLVGTIERRLLVNYRVDPVVAAGWLPSPLRPRLVRGHAVAGLCLLRLGDLRPPGVPARLGLTSENVAHRVAVEWDSPHGVADGVFISRRDTTSWASVAFGGRLFPGDHHRARFSVHEDGSRLSIAYAAADGATGATVHARTGGPWGSELFDDLAAAASFFRSGCDGYSPTRSGPGLQGLRLHSVAWDPVPVTVESASSRMLDGLPAGAAELDCALLLRDLPVRWESLPPLRG